MRKHIFLKFAVPAAMISLNACGSATFDSGSTGKQNGNATGTPGYTGQKVDQLTWFWQCESAPETAPQTSGGDVVISMGAGSIANVPAQVAELLRGVGIADRLSLADDLAYTQATAAIISKWPQQNARK